MSKINIKGFSSKQGANFNEIVSEPLQSILDFDKEKFSKTSIKLWNVGEDTSMTFLGKDLTYSRNADNEVTAIKTGTITSFTVVAEGAKVFDATDLSLTGKALTKAIESGKTSTFLNAFLNGDDVINATKYADVFWGGNGNDRLYGLGGDDTISGGSGNDKIYGGDGKDKLKGDAGNDRLEGGAGADKLYGGAGKDTFVFRTKSDSTTSASDKIYDFSQKEKDRIDLSDFDANTKLAKMQDFNFIGTKAFKHAGDLRYEIKKGDTFIHGDLDGDGKADFTIVLDAQVKLVLGDFIL